MHHASYALSQCKLVTDKAILDKQAVIIVNGRINAIIPNTDIPDGLPVHYLEDQWLCPGFIDLQLNGCGGVLFNDAIREETLDIMHQTNLRFGCTRFLPTLITSSDADIRQAIAITQSYQARHPDRVSGLHLEGPWLNPARKGIHDITQIRKPDPTLLSLICENSHIVRLITLAPEICPAGTIERLTEAGIRVSIGHTAATSAQTEQALRAGAHFVTHLFNAMPPLTNREPGPIGAILDHDSAGARNHRRWNPC